MQPGILLEVGNNRHGSPRVGETSTAAASSMLPPDVTRHFSYWLFLWHDGGDGPPRRRFTSPRAPLKIQEHATLLDSETVSLLWLASKEPCESSEMLGPPQAASWTLVRTELRTWSVLPRTLRIRWRDDKTCSLHEPPALPVSSPRPMLRHTGSLPAERGERADLLHRENGRRPSCTAVSKSETLSLA